MQGTISLHPESSIPLAPSPPIRPFPTTPQCRAAMVQYELVPPPTRVDLTDIPTYGAGTSGKGGIFGVCGA